ncbi:YoaK family protein [Lactiplantibacillus sp. DA1]|uniref:YoaK family protein n=1 Tax=Lactiplantibacillus sp. DA1 TaxID=3079857 RepID=UPI00292A66A9|nr:YoaK family protein [Lactiplantibacillus sp. DA1]MDV0430563.1 YoaK family protein [Lactiplantibacillus sp. DA1]
MQRFQSRHLFQLREIGLGLTFIGGFIDAYTFIQRGGVLAAGQTGNLIFLSVDVAQWNLPGVLTKLATVLFFTLGVIVVGILKQWLGAHSHYWRLPVLVAGLVVCLMVGALPATVSNAVVVPPLAFVMAMQTTAFSAIAGYGYNNVFSTGNLKKATVALTNYWLAGSRTDLATGLVYWELVLSFAGGAIVSAILQRWWTLRTIWIAAGLLVLVGGYYTWLLVYRAANGEE